MNTVISFKIDNLIQNYCNNFLSYLYTNHGWKRTIFDTCKENYIESEIESKKIRILISNGGEILLTCYCVFDIIKSMEFIISEFKYGRMEYYIILDENTTIDKTFTTVIKMQDYFYEKEEICETDFGKISLFEYNSTLTYKDWEDGKDLIDLFLSAMYDEEESYEEQLIQQEIGEEIKEDKEEKKTNINNEKIILSVLFLYSMIRLTELL